jgi:hypothetical protein
VVVAEGVGVGAGASVLVPVESKGLADAAGLGDPLVSSRLALDDSVFPAADDADEAVLVLDVLPALDALGVELGLDEWLVGLVLVPADEELALGCGVGLGVDGCGVGLGLGGRGVEAALDVPV